MAIRILNAAAVRDLLPYAECIPLMRRAFELESEGKTQQPIRQALVTPSRDGLLSIMPGQTDEPPWLGIKIVTVFPGNFGSHLGSHQGVVLLFDAQNGMPLAFMDGREITAIRTAAATAAATDILARQDARSLTVFGYGEQARTHLEALCVVRPFQTVSVWGRDEAKGSTFAALATEALDRQVTFEPNIERAAEGEVLCLTTSASEPYFRGEWLQPGQHLNVVGSSIPTTSEIDTETVTGSRVFVDFLESAIELAGDLRRAQSAGCFSFSDVVGSVGDVITGKCAGRTSAADVTLFKSLGMICEDILAADLILKCARAQAVGPEFEW